LSRSPTRSQVNAFINELNAQRGKKITKQAYQILLAAAQYLLNTLP